MKIQVLELPTEYVGEQSKTPYALIISGTSSGEVSQRYVDNLLPLTNKEGGPLYIIAAEEEIEI